MGARPVRVLAILGLVLLVGSASAAQAPAPSGAASAMGTIRADCERFELTLVSGRKPAREVTGVKGSAAVPAGTYYVLHSEAEFTDKVGRVWRVRNGMVGAPIEVHAGQTTQVALGAPLEVRLEARVESGSVIVKAEFWGPMNERSEGIAVEGGSLSAFRVRILDAGGKVVARPEGGYCCKFTGSVVWPIPAGVTGPLRVVSEVAFGPVPVWSESSPTVELPAAAEGSKSVGPWALRWKESLSRLRAPGLTLQPRRERESARAAGDRRGGW
jgi:hypothetical protein